MAQRPIAIIFAGVVGCSKTPVANYLSYQLNLPVFASDPIRSEVIEDGSKDRYEEETTRRRNERLEEILSKRMSVILDSSVDRTWGELKEKLLDAGYCWKIISFNLSHDKLTEMLTQKGYVETLARIDKLIAEHDEFFKTYSKEVDVIIDDNNFADRLEICLNATKDFAGI